MRTRRSIGLALLLLLAATAVSADRAEERFEQTYPFSAGQRLTLDNTNGDVFVEAWDGDEVQIVATKRIKSRRESADALLRELTIDVQVNGSGIEIETLYPKRRGFLGMSDVNASVEYDIRVPRQAGLELRTVNGEIEVVRIEGEMRLRSTNGGIAVVDSAGSVNAATTNGGIRAELEQVSGEDMEFSTTNGGIRVYLPSNLSASVDARTTNGSIETDFPVEVRGTFRRTRLSGDINGGGPELELETTNGSIRILER